MKRRALVSASCAAVVLVALVAVLATRSQAPAVGGFSSLGGKRAPAISGRSVMTGKPVSLASERGRFVLVEFFASWCSTCLAEVPQIESFLFQHRAQGDVAVIGVDISDARANAISFMERTGATWPAIVDSNDSIAERYGVASPPAAFLVNPQGKVVAHFTTGVTASLIDQAIAAERHGAHRVAT